MISLNANILPESQANNVQYSLDVAAGTLNADGFDRHVTTYNASYPGPKIEACWGDTLRINGKTNSSFFILFLLLLLFFFIFIF